MHSKNIASTNTCQQILDRLHGPSSLPLYAVYRRHYRSGDVTDPSGIDAPDVPAVLRRLISDPLSSAPHCKPTDPSITVCSSTMADWTVEHEGMDKHSSAVVAPLNIQKSPKRSRAGIFGHSRQSSRGSQSIRSQSQSQISPPLTPKPSTEALSQQMSTQPVFHNYLRAFYHYVPTSTVSSSTDESSITVAIKQGDVILVHSVHPNGWADGTLLASGARGWLPTNYCEPYDHPAVRNLLTALTHLWDLVRDGENGDLVAFMKQDYVRGMIAGIRFFLVSDSFRFGA